MSARHLPLVALAGLLLLPAGVRAQSRQAPPTSRAKPTPAQKYQPAPEPSAPAVIPLAGKEKPQPPTLPDPRDFVTDPAELVDVRHHIPDAVIEMRYATSNNFVGEAMYPEGARCLLRWDVLERLVRVASVLREQDLRLKLWDCYRPIAVQWKLWERFPKPGYVADPRRGGNHNRGAAIDLTLVDANGVELEMPTPYDSFKKAAHQGYTGGTARSRDNRERLRRAMVEAGFRINRSEWWHFDAPGALRLPVRDEPLVIEARP